GQHLPALEDSFLAVASLGFATVGGLIASRRSNAVGWLLSLIGLGLGTFPFTEEYTIRSLVTGTGSLPAVQWVAWVHQWVALLTRFSRSTGDERQQLKWVAYAAGVTTVLGILGLTLGGIVGGPAGNVAHGLFLFSLGFGIPGAIAVAVFKHRLYELDFVVKK